ncbi:MAG: hypothetical protein RLZZ338_2268 [Cyanobacteriota bacterium]
MSTETHFVHRILRLIGLPSETEEIKPAEAGFALRARYANVCVDAVSTAQSSAIASCSPHQKKRDRLVWALGGDRVFFTSSKKTRSSWAAWARSRSTYH